MSWTEERVETLKQMWADGRTASQIAKELGGVTRNSVIGKLNRLGLSRTASGSRKPKQPPSKPPGAPERQHTVVLPVVPDYFTGWNKSETKEYLKHLYEAGLRDSELCTEMNRLFPKRGSVFTERAIGYELKRMLSTTEPVQKPKTAPMARRYKPPPTAEPELHRRWIPGYEVPEDVLNTAQQAEKASKRITLMELTERTCKWPIGDPAKSNFAFCGLPALPDKSYCEAHCGVAYQPLSTRRTKKRGNGQKMLT